MVRDIDQFLKQEYSQVYLKYIKSQVNLYYILYYTTTSP